ncbi:MAG TPA: AAA family ATPase, partial [Roseiflexaceae bacterium]|nr:AAA family ATPase [Roseiflexaceae bacterium]
MTDEATRRILDALAPYKNTDHGSNRYNTPWRPGSDGGTLAVDQDAAYGLGLKWFDHKDNATGNGWTLAERLGIAIGGRTPDDDTPYASLADYAHAHGCPVDVFTSAGWSETTRRGFLAFAFKTATGTRYRYADPKAAKRKYDSDSGYKNCWYGLRRAVDLASQGAPFVICNGEPSTVAALHHGVAACCVTGGEKGVMPAHLLNELKAAWNGPILVAFDCDTTGRKAGAGLATFLRDAGLDARAINLQGADGFDIADYCRIHNGTSAQSIAALPELRDQRAEIVRLAPTALAAAQPVGGLPTIIRASDLATMVFEAMRWTVDGILPEGACLLAAKPKAKKSWLALAIAVAVASAGKVLGYYDVLPGGALYLDLESNERRFQARLKSMLGNAPFPENLEVAHKWGRGEECLRNIETYCYERPDTRVIVIDILARVR